MNLPRAAHPPGFMQQTAVTEEADHADSAAARAFGKLARMTKSAQH
jgi:hypothetical protein